MNTIHDDDATLGLKCFNLAAQSKPSRDYVKLISAHTNPLRTEIEALRKERDCWIDTAKNLQVEANKHEPERRRITDLERVVGECEKALKMLVDECFVEHTEPDCPEDDTCACPEVGAVNKALASIDALGLGKEKNDPS